MWDDPTNAQKILRERENLKSALNRVTAVTQDLEDIVTLVELAEAENDTEAELVSSDTP